MGGTESKTQESTSNGEVINNVTIDQDVKVTNSHILILLSIIAVIKILELLYHVYSIHRRNLQKRYKSKLAPILEDIQYRV